MSGQDERTAAHTDGEGMPTEREWLEGLPEGRSAATCHCGRTVEPRDPDPWEGRMDAYCEDCALNRCDCYPDECPVKYGPTPSAAHTDSGASNDLAGTMPDAGHEASELAPDATAASSFRAAGYVSCPSHDLLVPLDERGKLIGSCPGCVAEAAAGVKRLKGRIRYRNLKAGGAK